MSRVLLGNIIGLISSLIMVSTGVFKTKKQVLIMQSIELGLASICSLILGGYSGAIIYGLSIFRNLLCYKDKLHIKEKIILTVVFIVVTIVFNNMGIIGYLPLVGSIIYIWLIDIKDMVKFKYMNILVLIIWCIYDFSIKSYSIFTFDIASILSNFIGIIRAREDKKL